MQLSTQYEFRLFWKILSLTSMGSTSSVVVRAACILTISYSLYTDYDIDSIDSSWK